MICLIPFYGENDRQRFDSFTAMIYRLPFFVILLLDDKEWRLPFSAALRSVQETGSNKNFQLKSDGTLIN